jgi:hypothetical protein
LLIKKTIANPTQLRAKKRAKKRREPEPDADVLMDSTLVQRSKLEGLEREKSGR